MTRASAHAVALAFLAPCEAEHAACVWLRLPTLPAYFRLGCDVYRAWWTFPRRERRARLAATQAWHAACTTHPRTVARGSTPRRGSNGTSRKEDNIMCDKCDKDSDAFVRGMATIFWGLAWADHADKHGCTNLSGCKVGDYMPEIPERAWRMAERAAGYIEGVNDQAIYLLFVSALEADGHGEVTHEDYHGDLAERFGECLAYAYLGHGVSWFDNHAKFPIKIPHGDTDLESYAARTCEDDGPNVRCAKCGDYNPPHKLKCGNCGAEVKPAKRKPAKRKPAKRK